MGDFILRAKDLFASHPTELAYFHDVFEKLDELAKVKNFFNCDLFNIEEALSILEMNQALGGAGDATLLSKFICDVIKYSTPSIISADSGMASNWAPGLFGRQDQWRTYLLLVSNFIRARISLVQQKGLTWELDDINEIQYSAITFNYDLVVENCLKFMRSCYAHGGIAVDTETGSRRFPYIKLHGSADGENIVPPTWNKGLHSNIVPQWQRAYELIVRAQHIRFLGYSLPVSDSYARYLFKSALLKSEYLKTVDVLTMDSDGHTEARYRELFNFKYFRFKNTSLQDYLSHLSQQFQMRAQNLPLPNRSYTFNNLEDAHNLAMRT